MAWPYFLDCDRFFASEQEGCFDPLAGLKGTPRTALVNETNAVVLSLPLNPGVTSFQLDRR